MTEQDFIAPENVQALIWKELVPDLLVSATLPRWWDRQPRMSFTPSLSISGTAKSFWPASTKDPQLRAKVINILSDRMMPATFGTR